jgi:hypothetical protein
MSRVGHVIFLTMLLALFAACSNSGPSKNAKDTARSYVQALASGNCTEAEEYALPGGQTGAVGRIQDWCRGVISVKVDDVIELSGSGDWVTVRFLGELTRDSNMGTGGYCTAWEVVLQPADGKWYVFSTTGKGCS